MTATSGPDASALAVGALAAAGLAACLSRASALPAADGHPPAAAAAAAAAAVRGLPRHFSSRGAAKKHGSTGRGELIVAENVDEYRGLIASAVRDGDTVLEIGCHAGMTTHLLAQCCGPDGLVVGADKSAHWLAVAKVRFPAVRFDLIDCFDMGALLRLERDLGRPFSCIFVDVSGSRELRSLIPLLEALEGALSAEMIVVKSFRLARLRRRLRGATEYGSGSECRGGSGAEVAARTAMLGDAMRQVQLERKERAAAVIVDDDGEDDGGGCDGDTVDRLGAPEMAVAAAPSAASQAALAKQLQEQQVKSQLKKQKKADWKATCRGCGAAKGLKAFSVKQQRQVDGGGTAQCKACVAEGRKPREKREGPAKPDALHV